MEWKILSGRLAQLSSMACRALLGTASHNFRHEVCIKTSLCMCACAKIMALQEIVWLNSKSAYLVWIAAKTRVGK